MAYNTDGTVTATKSPFTGGTSSLANRLASGGYADPMLNALKPQVQGPALGYQPTTNSPVATPTTVPQTTVPKTTAPTLNTNQQALLKKNNPELYSKLYGSTPAEVNVADIGTQGLNVGSQGTDTTSDTFIDTATQNAAQAQADAQTQAETEATQTGGNKDLAQVRDWMQQVFVEGQSFDPSKIKTEEGVYTAKDELNAINNEIIAEGKATRDRIMEMRQNPEGKLAGALAAEIENYKYERADYMADLAISQMAIQGKYDSAVEIASDRIKAEEQRYDRQTQFLKDYYTMLQDDMTEKEKMQFQSQLAISEYTTKNYLDSKKEALRAAQANGAPIDIITGIKNAKTTDDVWAVAGKYGIDPNLQLNRDKFAWDKWYAQQKLDAEKAAADAKITEEQRTDGELVMKTIKQAGNTLTAVREALGNRIGMGAATGVVKGPFGTSLAYAVPGALGGAGLGTAVAPGPGTLLGGFGGFVTGGIVGTVEAEKARKDFENDIRLITSATGLQALNELGVKLTPITNFEIDKVTEMANQVGASVRVVTNEKTNESTITIEGSTEEFQKNLKALETQLTTTIETLSEDPNFSAYLLANDMGSIESVFNQK